MPRTQMRLAVMALLVQLGMATNYTVGGGSGSWDTSSNPEAWASGQQFVVGDNLIFQFTLLHDVLEVSKADYDSCSTSNPTQTYSSSPAVIPLSSPGKRWFICGTIGHCGQGMKMEVDTLASSSPPSTSPAPSTSSPAPSTSSPAPSTSSPTPSTPSPTPSTSSPAPPPTSPVTPPSSPPSPQTSSSPKSSPLPSSPTSSPPPSSEGPSVGSPTSSPPPPSSAYRGSVQASLIMGFSFGMTFLLAL